MFLRELIDDRLWRDKTTRCGVAGCKWDHKKSLLVYRFIFNALDRRGFTVRSVMFALHTLTVDLGHEFKACTS